MSEVYLHIGHGKTGSSYIQSVLNLSREYLLDEGFLYPLENKDLEDPEKISSGNGRLIYNRSLNWLDSRRSVIFSDEHLFRMLCDRNYFQDLTDRFKCLGFTKMNILLFTRNPISHAASLYQQSVKRDGKFYPIEKIFRSYDTPEKVMQLIEMVSSDHFFDISLYNYSRNRKDLVGRLAGWLSLNRDVFVLPKKSVINRSLTVSELYVQSIFNKYLGKCSGLISDPLCESLPNVKSEVVLPDCRVQMDMIERLKPALGFVNAMFPEETYEVDTTETGCSLEGEKVFSEKQLDVICESLAKRILEQRKMIHELRGTRIRSNNQ